MSFFHFPFFVIFCTRNVSRFHTHLAPWCEDSMIRLKMLLPLQLCGLMSFQHSPELFRLILTFHLFIALSIATSILLGPTLLCWFHWCKLLSDIASSHMCIAQVLFTEEPDVPSTTTPNFVLCPNCSNFQGNWGSSFQQDSTIFETSAALSSGLETSVMFPRNVLSIPLSSVDFILIFPKFVMDAPEAALNSPHFPSGKSPAIAIGSTVVIQPLHLPLLLPFFLDLSLFCVHFCLQSFS